jgi:hypothetical protein
MSYAVAIVTVLVMLYGLAAITDCVTRDPRTLSREKQAYYERRLSIWVVVLIVAALFLGSSLENII